MRKRGALMKLSAVILSLAVAASAFGADPPVKVTVTLNGDATPGATITAKANVTINDGTTVQSYKWTRTGGIEATLTGTSSDTVTIALPSRKAYRENLIKILEEPPISD